MADSNRWDPFDFRFPATPFRRMLHWSPFGGEPWWRFGLEDWWPRLDVFSDEEDLVVKAEVPGMNVEDISVTLEEDALVIRGKKEREEEVEEKDYYRMERSYGSFIRSVQVPEGVKESDVSATYSDGILEVRVKEAGRLAGAKQKAIPIKAVSRKRKVKAEKGEKKPRK